MGDNWNIFRDESRILSSASATSHRTRSERWRSRISDEYQASLCELLLLRIFLSKQHEKLPDWPNQCQGLPRSHRSVAGKTIAPVILSVYTRAVRIPRICPYPYTLLTTPHVVRSLTGSSGARTARRKTSSRPDAPDCS